MFHWQHPFRKIKTYEQLFIYYVEEASLWQASKHALPYESRKRMFQITTTALNFPIQKIIFTTMMVKSMK